MTFIVCSEKIINLGNLYFDSRCILHILNNTNNYRKEKKTGALHPVPHSPSKKNTMQMMSQLIPLGN